MPVSNAQTHNSLWRDEGSTSMRALGYFIGAFAVALILGIGSAWYMIERGSMLTTHAYRTVDELAQRRQPQRGPLYARPSRPQRAPAAHFHGGPLLCGQHGLERRPPERGLRIYDRWSPFERPLVVDRALRRARVHRAQPIQSV